MLWIRKKKKMVLSFGSFNPMIIIIGNWNKKIEAPWNNWRINLTPVKVLILNQKSVLLAEQ